jgi:hypothetical protein
MNIQETQETQEHIELLEKEIIKRISELNQFLKDNNTELTFPSWWSDGNIEDEGRTIYLCNEQWNQGVTSVYFNATHTFEIKNENCDMIIVAQEESLI